MMRRVQFLSALLIVVSTFLMSPPPAAGQQADLNAILKRFNQFYDAGNYSAALVEAQRYETTVKSRLGTNHSNYALALLNLGRVLREREGSYAEAEAHFKRALAIYEAKLGRDHLYVATTHSH